MGFLNKIEILIQYRQTVMMKETINFFQVGNTKISEIIDNDNGSSI